MREMLFRGKGNTNYNDGVWYYGVPIQDQDGDWQICTHYSKRVVIPETIGQYTGLTDENGKKIFEGDIVKADNGHISEVTFHFGAFCCYCQCHDTHNTLWGDILTVIGNIHDNPELLKGDKDND